MNVHYRAGGGEPGYIAPDPKDLDVFFSGTNNGRYLDRYNRRLGTTREVNPGQPANKIPAAFERRCTRAGPLRSALLLGGIALLFPSRRALPARRLTALGARAALSTDCYPWFYSGEPAIDMLERWQWTFPIIFSPIDPNVLYTSSNRLWRTTDDGDSWERLSDDLTRADPMTLGHSGGPITGDMNGPEVVQPADEIPAAFERRCTRAGPLRSACPQCHVGITLSHV